MNSRKKIALLINEANDYFKNAEYEKSLEITSELSKLYPKDIQIRISHALNISKTGNSEKALVILNEVEKFSYDNLFFYSARAAINKLLGNKQQVILDYKSAYKLDKKNIDVLVNLAGALGENQEYQLGLEFCEKALEINKDDYIAIYNKGFMLMKLYRFKEASILMEKANKIDSNHNTMKSLSIIYHNLGNKIKALNYENKCDGSFIFYTDEKKYDLIQ